jgi:FlaA1/EpsC-like NDP-sugar epimerase
LKRIDFDIQEAEPKSRTEAASRAETNRRRLLRQVLCAASLAPVFVGVYYFSYWLRYEGQLEPKDLQRFTSTVALVVLIKVVLFGWFRVYEGWGRYVTFYDLVSLVQASLASLLLTALVERLFLHSQPIPRTVFLVDCGGTIVVLGGIRALVRIIREHNWSLYLTADKVPAFIVGANDAGEALLRSIVRNEKLTYHILGFLDDDVRRLGTRIAGVPVIGTIDQTCLLAERRGVRDVLIAADGLSGRQVRKLVDEGRQTGVRVKVLPSYEQLISGSVAIRPRAVSINDLLRREPVQLEMENIRQWIDDRVLLVTGSAGSIGSEICRQLLCFSPRKIVLVDRNENGQFFLQRELRELAPNVELDVAIADLLDRWRIGALLREHRPQIVFHAAAYKHVPLMESHPGEAVKNIVAATRGLADLAMEHLVESFVMISTDKAVNPTSVMGACKRAAELYVQSATEASPCRFVTVRFGNVLDSAGSVVQVFRQQIAAGGPVTVTDRRMRRFFMTIPEAARLVIQAGAIGNDGEILLLDMGEPIRIVDLAADMIRLSGLTVGEDIEIRIVGLRPGEKLYEELHADGERHLPTRHPKIVVADRQRRDPDSVAASIQQLEREAKTDPQKVNEVLRQMIPEYREADSSGRKAA